MRGSCLVVPRIIVIAGLSAIAIAASGCSETPTPKRRARPRRRPSTSRPSRQHSPRVNISTFRAAFEETFGTPPDERPWYGLITGMKLAPREIVTATSSYRVLEVTIKSESLSDTATGEICEAVFALDSKTRIGIKAVRISPPTVETAGARDTGATVQQHLCLAETPPNDRPGPVFGNVPARSSSGGSSSPCGWRLAMPRAVRRGLTCKRVC